MKRLVAAALVTMTAFVAAACTESPVVLATIPPSKDDRPPPPGPQRCSHEECGPGSYCERPSCESPAGTCVPLPTECKHEEDPVCGCDGITYFNDCLRQAAGIGVLHRGACEQAGVPCRDRSECPPGAFCGVLIGGEPSPECGPALEGRCWVLPIECPPAGGNRWQACVGIPPGPEPPPPLPCLDTCSAVRSGEPHHLAIHCE